MQKKFWINGNVLYHNVRNCIIKGNSLNSHRKSTAERKQEKYKYIEIKQDATKERIG